MATRGNKGKHVGTIIVQADPWVNVDGRLNAPSGPNVIIFPTLLNDAAYVSSGSPRRTRAINGSYLVTDSGRRQPPWMVAGVDYAVGPNGSLLTAISGGAFTPAFTTYCGAQATAAGGTFTNSFPAARFDNCTGLTIDGWDITGGNIYLVNNCIGTTITNCKIVTAGAGTGSFSCVHVQFGAGSRDVTIKYCDLSMPVGADGNACLAAGTDPTGTVIIQYCYLHDTWQQIVSIAGEFSLDYRFNLIANAGSRPVDNTPHINYLIPNVTNNKTCREQIQFNTTLQYVQPATGEGFQFHLNDNDSSGNTQSYPILYANTMIASTINPAAAARQSNHLYAVGDIITAVGGACTYYFCTVGGTSAGVSPNYALVAEFATVVDGTATFMGRTQSITSLNHGSIDGGAGFITPITGGGVCRNNYMDNRGCGSGSFWYTTGAVSPPNSFDPGHGWSYGSNYDMTTGSVINPDNSE